LKTGEFEYRMKA